MMWSMTSFLEISDIIKYTGSACYRVLPTIMYTSRKKHFFEMKGDVGMSSANYERREQDYSYYKHIILHPYIFRWHCIPMGSCERCI